MYRDRANGATCPRRKMNVEGWAISVLLIVGGIVVLNHLGVDLGAAIGSSMRGLEHWLGSPL